MKTRRTRKPTNKDLQILIQEIQYRLIATHSQLNALTEVFSDFLDYTHKKAKFIEYLEAKKEKEAKKAPGSVENPTVLQEELV